MELGAFAASKSTALLAAAEAMIAEHAETETETQAAATDDAADPADVFQGLSIARRAAFRGARRAAAAVVIDPIRDYTAGDASSSDAISRAVRRVPFAAVTGAKGCARAVDAALSGAAKSLRAAADDSESTRAVDATRVPE
jgi:autophagy-related protein 2